MAFLGGNPASRLSEHKNKTSLWQRHNPCAKALITAKLCCPRETEPSILAASSCQSMVLGKSTLPSQDLATSFFAKKFCHVLCPGRKCGNYFRNSLFDFEKALRTLKSALFSHTNPEGMLELHIDSCKQKADLVRSDNKKSLKFK